jgi:prepilin-type N-terminal cleavage/methylation domain-containing protein
MTTRSRSGFTLAEVLIALAVIGVAFGALALTQVTNLRASVTARTATETKAAANLALERLLAQVLETTGDGTEASPFVFAFDAFYLDCPGAPACTGWFNVRDGVLTAANASDGDADINISFTIAGVVRDGAVGEGVVAISVTAVHRDRDQTLSLGDRVTCYDVYPSPKSTAPAPCPTPGTGP